MGDHNEPSHGYQWRVPPVWSVHVELSRGPARCALWRWRVEAKSIATAKSIALKASINAARPAEQRLLRERARIRAFRCHSQEASAERLALEMLTAAQQQLAPLDDEPTRPDGRPQ